MRSTRPEAARWVGNVHSVSVERALADCERFGLWSPEDVRTCVIAALQQHLASPARIRAELDAGRLNKTAGGRQGLADFEAGAWSIPEAVLIRLLRCRWRSLTIIPNAVLTTPHGTYIGRPDVYLPTFGIAIQVHSRAHHSGFDPAGRDLWASTLDHDSRYPQHGITLIPVAPTLLRDVPGRFLDRVAGTMRRRRGLPLPDMVINPGRGQSWRRVDPPQGSPRSNETRRPSA